MHLVKEIKPEKKYGSAFFCHIVNKHNWGSATKYTKCVHSDLSETQPGRSCLIKQGSYSLICLVSC